MATNSYLLAYRMHCSSLLAAVKACMTIDIKKWMDRDKTGDAIVCTMDLISLVPRPSLPDFNVARRKALLSMQH